MATPSPERTLGQLDYLRLHRLVTRTPGIPATPAQEAMAEVLAMSDLVDPTVIDADVVTMQSRVRLADPQGGEAITLTLCYPEQSAPAEGRYSVLSPMGAAVLGLRVGAVAQWQTPQGEPRSAAIEEILFQPEASGDYLS